MKKWFGIVTIGLVGVFVFGNLLVAEDRQRAGGVHGTFVRLIEQKVGDQVYMGVVIKPHESDDHVTVLVPRRPESLVEKVRKLRKGQEVEVPYITDGGQKWVKAPESEHRREGPERAGDRREERRVPGRPSPPRGERLEREPSRGLAGQLEQLANQIRQFAERLRRMENEIRELRTENERLKRMLRQRDSRGEDSDRRNPDRPRQRDARRNPDPPRQRDVRRDSDRPREEQVKRDRPDAQRRRHVRDGGGVGDRRVRPSLPDGMAGFRGVLIGSLKRKLDRGFLLKVDRLGEVWENNKADNPKAAIGKEVMITTRPEGMGERFLQTLRKLEIGQKVLVEVFHSGGNQLTAIEQFKAID